MSAMLPINVDDLVHCRTIEPERVKFKAVWHPETTGFQVLKTLCAFANDYHNLNGGYVVLGVAEERGIGVMPPRGLSAAEIEDAGKWIRGHCNRIDPVFQPVISPEVVAGRNILVLWAPGSDSKPHQAPDGRRGARKFWVRVGAETVDAQANGLLPALLAQTARVPWDDRRAFEAHVTDLRPDLVRGFLREVGSALAEDPDHAEVYRRMRLTMPANDHELPRNVGLLFFSDDPERWFRGARIEAVQFPDGPGGDVLVERVFRGGLASQLRDCLRYVEGLTTTVIRKRGDRFDASSSKSYPPVAVREALVNAVYHRGYRADTPEPTKVYLYPDRMEITSYPGPVPGVETGHFAPGARTAAVPARNRRIGELLKELKLAEGRLTGVGKIFDAMKRNGSPPPAFDFDPGRSYFRVTLPIHPGHKGL